MTKQMRVVAQTLFAIFLVIGGGVIGVSLVPPEVEKIVEVEKIMYVGASLKEFEDVHFLRQWLRQNTISERIYTRDYFCLHFSQDLVRAARANGYEMFIYMYFDDSENDKHAIVYTYINNEPFFIEPQTDEIVAIGWGE